MSNLKRLRMSSNLTLRELQKYTNISRTTLSQLENGIQPFKEEHVQKLSSFFDVTSDYLLAYSKSGIGVYFDGAEDDNVHEFINDNELISLEVHIDILENKVPYKWIIKMPQEEKICYLGKYGIFRSINTTKENAGISVSVKDKINKEIARLDVRELEKVLKFIEDYIK